jgi:hypothetical protein
MNVRDRDEVDSNCPCTNKVRILDFDVLRALDIQRPRHGIMDNRVLDPIVPRRASVNKSDSGVVSVLLRALGNFNVVKLRSSHANSAIPLHAIGS